MTATIARTATRTSTRPVRQLGQPATHPTLLPLTVPDIRPAPAREPGFDDEVAHLGAIGPLDRPLPFADEQRPAAPAPPLPRALPDPVAWARRLLIGIIETAGGRRPLQQLAAMLSPSVAAGLSADFESAARRNERHWTHAAAVRSVHASEPADGVAELNATVLAGRRVRAVALRLEVREGRWRCTRLQLG
jgi:hypothetical protein